jgi:hypothetical protein
MDATGKVCCIVCRPTLCHISALYAPNMHQELDNVQHNIRRLNHQLSQIFWGMGVKLKKRTHIFQAEYYAARRDFFCVHFNSSSTNRKYNILTPDTFLYYSHDTI